jgi:hypothetical protein
VNVSSARIQGQSLTRNIRHVPLSVMKKLLIEVLIGVASGVALMLVDLGAATVASIGEFSHTVIP